MNKQLHDIFKKLFSTYSDNKNLENESWKELEKNYTNRKRHYHNLNHLESIINELENPGIEIKDWDSVLFSVFYHDIVYQSTAKDNEEKSAEKAKIVLQKINLPSEQIDNVSNQIFATKSHEKSNDSDTNYLLDADLSILGKSWDEYEKYTKQIRKEYSIYPNFLYNPGRKKVLEHFLTFDEIYKTEFFKERYEKQARENITKEIELLS
ncbi:HD domain-containing protein [Chryseobacterium potabilaquae]|uniref:Metal-dependent HD superfamily phosphohydrolase n=1 Tax=Chryseobacterium potabilaquae TaxID=2675057 RepID=A0A6N4XDY4_9FLAO|nr:hypothetical protein [Chryseobacterium potabilaquae]CAA7197198.1 hypothetical protein CHRY9293_03252 [Chryseobacterium potabilaquae]